jgi:hypothetical protein
VKLIACNDCGGYCSVILIPRSPPDARVLLKEVFVGSLRRRGLGLSSGADASPHSTHGWAVLLACGVLLGLLASTGLVGRIVGALWLAQYLFYTVSDAAHGMDGPAPLIDFARLRALFGAGAAILCVLVVAFAPAAAALVWHQGIAAHILAPLGFAFVPGALLLAFAGAPLLRVLNPARILSIYDEAPAASLALIGGLAGLVAFHALTWPVHKALACVLVGISGMYLDVALARGFGLVVAFKGHVLTEREDILVPALGDAVPAGGTGDEDGRVALSSTAAIELPTHTPAPMIVAGALDLGAPSQKAAGTEVLASKIEQGIELSEDTGEEFVVEHARSARENTTPPKTAGKRSS